MVVRDNTPVSGKVIKMSIKVSIIVILLIFIFLMGDSCVGEYTVVSYKCIDIGSKCNMGFSDPVSDDREGGWTDDGPKNDLSNFPTGKQNFNGIPFDIINPDLNRGKSCIVLKSKVKTYFPEEVNDIEIDSPAKKLHFVHAMSRTDEKPGKYVVHYDCGSTVDIPLENKYNIYNWWYPKDLNLENVRFAWTGKNPRRSSIGVFHYAWENPHPEKVIKSLDFVSYESNASPILVAVTAETKKPAANLQLQGEKTNVSRGEDIKLNVFAHNLIGEPKTVRAIITPPSGWKVVNSSNFSESAPGQYSATFTLKPGVGKDFEVNIKPKGLGNFEVKGMIVYRFGDPPGENHTKIFSPIPVTVIKHESEPGFEAIFSIVGLLTVAYVMNRRKRD